MQPRFTVRSLRIDPAMHWAGRRPAVCTPGMLLLADRNFPSVRLWRLFTMAGADLLWRAKEPVANRIARRLPDGSYLAKFGDGKQTLTVRLIEYALPGSTTIYRLLTNLLDPVMAPPHELAALYAERWEIEVCYGELKVVQWALRGLRSLSVDGGYQEFWAHCTLYQISRRLACQAAMETPDRDCDRISFSAVQDALRRGARLATGLTVRRVTAALRAALGELIAARALLSGGIASARASPATSSPGTPAAHATQVLPPPPSLDGRRSSCASELA